MSGLPFPDGETPACVATKGHVPQLQGSVLMSVARITVRKHEDVPGQGSHRGPPRCPCTMKNWLCPSLDVVFWRAVPISHCWPCPEDICVSELTLSLIYYGDAPLPLTPSSRWQICPQDHELRELSLTLTSFGTQRNRPWPHLANRLGLVLSRGMVVPGLSTRVQEIWPHYSSTAR